MPKITAATSSIQTPPPDGGLRALLRKDTLSSASKTYEPEPESSSVSSFVIPVPAWEIGAMRSHVLRHQHQGNSVRFAPYSRPAAISGQTSQGSNFEVFEAVVKELEWKINDTLALSSAAKDRKAGRIKGIEDQYQLIVTGLKGSDRLPRSNRTEKNIVHLEFGKVYGDEVQLRIRCAGPSLGVKRYDYTLRRPIDVAGKPPARLILFCAAATTGKLLISLDKGKEPEKCVVTDGVASAWRAHVVNCSSIKMRNSDALEKKIADFTALLNIEFDAEFDAEVASLNS
jgi:hypothetical protein